MTIQEIETMQRNNSVIAYKKKLKQQFKTIKEAEYISISSCINLDNSRGFGVEYPPQNPQVVWTAPSVIKEYLSLSGGRVE